MKSLVDKQNRTRRENERRAVTGRQQGLRLRCEGVIRGWGSWDLTKKAGRG